MDPGVLVFWFFYLFNLRNLWIVLLNDSRSRALAQNSPILIDGVEP
jgi:hypothetical protein